MLFLNKPSPGSFSSANHSCLWVRGRSDVPLPFGEEESCCGGLQIRQALQEGQWGRQPFSHTTCSGCIGRCRFFPDLPVAEERPFRRSAGDPQRATRLCSTSLQGTNFTPCRFRLFYSVLPAPPVPLPLEDILHLPPQQDPLPLYSLSRHERAWLLVPEVHEQELKNGLKRSSRGRS